MTAPQQKVLLLGAAFDTGNMGVGALAAGSIRVLHARYPAASIALLDYARQARAHEVEAGDTKITVDTVNIRYSWKLFLPNNILLLLVLACLACVPGLRRLVIGCNRTLREIDRAHAAFAISGGDSFSDIYGTARFFYVALPQLLVILLGKRLVLLPQTIGPFTRRLPTRVAAYIMARAERVYSRDSAGVEVARELVARPDGRIRFCHDVAFVLEPRRPQSVQMSGAAWEQLAGREIVGINVSGLLMMGGYDGRNMFALKVSYRELIDRLVRTFCGEHGAAVLLVPHVFSNDREGDQAACREVFERHAVEFADRIACILSVHDQHEIKHLIGRCGFFLGARMHACIAALSQAVPAIGIAYSRKFAGVLGSIGAGDLVVDPRDSDLEEILGRIEACFAERRTIAARLRETIPTVTRNVLGTLDDLA